MQKASYALLRLNYYLDSTWDKATEQLLAAQSERDHQYPAFLLRVGRHSGAESMTLNGVRSIKIIQGKDENGKNKSSNQDHTLTWWLASDEIEQQPLTLWLAVGGSAALDCVNRRMALS